MQARRGRSLTLRLGRRRWLRAATALAAILLAGRPPAHAQRRWTWAALPGTAPLSSQFPAEGNWWGVTGPRAVLGAWNGWAWDEAGETAWLFGCGGHTDYGGNEIYRWRPDEGFMRLNEPDTLEGAVGVGPARPVGADGERLARAPSVHTYAGQVFVDGVVHRFGGSSAWGGGFSRAYWMLDTRTLEHIEGKPFDMRQVRMPAAVWDARARRVLLHLGIRAGRLIDLATGASSPLAFGAWSADKVYAIDEGRRLLVHLAPRPKTWHLNVYDLDDEGRPGGHRMIPIEAPERPRAGRTLAYDPVGRRIVVWLGDVFIFDGARITRIEVANAVPSIDAGWGNGVYNRFSWAPSLHGFVTVVHPDDPGLVLRPGGA